MPSLKINPVREHPILKNNPEGVPCRGVCDKRCLRVPYSGPKTVASRSSDGGGLSTRGRSFSNGRFLKKFTRSANDSIRIFDTSDSVITTPCDIPAWILQS